MRKDEEEEEQAPEETREAVDLTDEELLTKYLETRNTEPERITALLDHAKSVFAGEE